MFVAREVQGRGGPLNKIEPLVSSVLVGGCKSTVSGCDSKTLAPNAVTHWPRLYLGEFEIRRTL